MNESGKRTIPVEKLVLQWRCEKEGCEMQGLVIKQPLIDLPSIGVPICTECDEYLELEDEVIIQEQIDE